MRYGPLLAMVGGILLTVAVTAQAGMNDFCARRWHGVPAMQQYCLDVETQSVERLAWLLDIVESTHERVRLTGGHTNENVAAECSRQHYLKVFDAYHNQLVEACLVQHLDRLQASQKLFQQYVASWDE